MSIKEKLSLKILDAMRVLHGHLNVYLRGYYLRKNLQHADKFLAWFRGRSNYTPPGMAGKRKPNHECKHLKGGALQPRYAKDYNVHAHTFADGSVTIRCANGCGFVSTPKDANWKDALQMAQQSSNRASSSERVFSERMTQKNEVTVVYQDKI